MIKQILSKLTTLEKIFVAAALAMLALAFFTMTLPWLRCPLCQGLRHWNEPCLWSPSTGATVLLSPYVTAVEDTQWEYGDPPLLQESYPSRRAAVIRLPAHTDSAPYFCPATGTSPSQTGSSWSPWWRTTASPSPPLSARKRTTTSMGWTAR